MLVLSIAFENKYANRMSNSHCKRKDYCSVHPLPVRSCPLNLVCLYAFMASLPRVLVQTKSFYFWLGNAREYTHLYDDFAWVHIGLGANWTD